MLTKEKVAPKTATKPGQEEDITPAFIDKQLKRGLKKMAAWKKEAKEEQKIVRGFEYHIKHTEMHAVMRGIKLVKCGQCGLVYDPALAGVAINDDAWEKLWRWTDK